MFFVMLEHPSPAVPAMVLVNDGEEIAFFDTAEAAREAADFSLLGERFGYELFELGTGES